MTDIFEAILLCVGIILATETVFFVGLTIIYMLQLVFGLTPDNPSLPSVHEYPHRHLRPRKYTFEQAQQLYKEYSEGTETFREFCDKKGMNGNTVYMIFKLYKFPMKK